MFLLFVYYVVINLFLNFYYLLEFEVVVVEFEDCGGFYGL